MRQVKETDASFITNKEEWTPFGACGFKLSLPVVLGSSIGGLLLIGIAALILSVVAINIRDKRRFERFEARKAANIHKLGQHSNPLYQSRATTFQNPAFSSN